jgi:DNA invertase Pin-like site-specific DNA recombinase
MVGYARVSTDGQTLDAQQAALREERGTQVFAKKQSGARTDRAVLARCIASLEAGDTEVITKLDRLAHSTRDLLNTLAAVQSEELASGHWVMVGPTPHSARQVDGDGLPSSSGI